MGVDLTNDERLAAVNNERDKEIAESNTRLDNMISDANGYYQDQVDATREWAETQKQNQQDQTDFAIEQIEQRKDQTHKDYIKEQTGAYTDYQAMINPYGVNAEKIADMGLTGSGYSESAQVRFYNQYQNRVATAREAFTRAVLNYDNAIKEANLQNNSILAEIAFEALQKELELSLQGFQYKNTLILQKAESERAIRNDYFVKWKAVLDQINTENAQAEQKRQFDEQMAEERRQFDKLNPPVDAIEKNEKKENYTGITSSMLERARKFSSNKALGNWIDELESSGKITGDEAERLYEEYAKLENSSWTLVSDGGMNWFWGIDGNAKVKDEFGNEYTMNGLKSALIKEGMTSESAKSYVKSLQKKLGA